MKNWMIYGAYGYSGDLIAREAKRRGLTPVLAGRSPEPLQKLGRALDLETRCFDLAKPEEIAGNLQNIDLVLHCAGPFSATSAPMLEACIRSGTHYLDITGEIDVFESIFARGTDVQKAGICAIPGVGFDVVPTDCLAAMLKQRMPDASHLTLAFKMGSKLSPGTAKSSIEGMTRLRIRRNGEIIPDPKPYTTREVEFEPGRTSVTMRIPWGDVSTAYYSTGIPNIEVYTATTPGAPRVLRLLSRVAGILPIQKPLKMAAAKMTKGPSEEKRRECQALLWGRVENPGGRSLQLRMRTPEGYDLTIASSLAAVERVLRGGVAPGALTPSRAFGSEFVLDLPGVEQMG